MGHSKETGEEPEARSSEMVARNRSAYDLDDNREIGIVGLNFGSPR